MTGDMKAVRVVVGSTNPTKIEGVRKAFLQYFDSVEVSGKEVDSSVSSQPFDDEVVKGAINRAKAAYSDGFDFSVGIEAGLFRMKDAITGFIDFQVAAIFDGERFSIGFGPGFEYPPIVVQSVLKGKEVGDVMEEITGIKDLGERFGAIHVLSKGAISRSELSRIAVTMALVPFLNSHDYF
jgi:inosine/xanthosine triphosphatase